jgi:hypothetical protein
LIARALRAGRAEQAARQLTTLDHQLVQRLGEMAILHDQRVALVGGEQRRLAQQLADEGGADAASLVEQPLALGDPGWRLG